MHYESFKFWVKSFVKLIIWLAVSFSLTSLPIHLNWNKQVFFFKFKFQVHIQSSVVVWFDSIFATKFCFKLLSRRFRRFLILILSQSLCPLECRKQNCTLRESNCKLINNNNNNIRSNSFNVTKQQQPISERKKVSKN